MGEIVKDKKVKASEKLRVDAVKKLIAKGKKEGILSYKEIMDSLEEISDMYEDGEAFQPEMGEDEREKLYRNWKLAVSATQAFKPE